MPDQSSDISSLIRKVQDLAVAAGTNDDFILTNDFAIYEVNERKSVWLAGIGNHGPCPLGECVSVYHCIGTDPVEALQNLIASLEAKMKEPS